ncbi:hypothetical protein MNBD_ALPHA02-2094 [hydrothermal vent metagenome]|uniref:Uncharacterized protein n=1 Tax=hydrothermal vent metagenome TaxID=652676 RepID=A0A3B0R487_9ZZZZ
MTKPLKILFINFPTIPMHEVDLILAKKNAMPHTMVIPLGILYLSSNLKSKVQNVEVRVLDYLREVKTNPERYSDSAEMIRVLAGEMAGEFTPDLICYSMLFSIIHPFFNAAATAHKKIWPKATLVAGGNHTTNAVNAVMDHPDLDYAARGECDFAFPEFVRQLQKGDVPQVQGIYSRTHVEGRLPMPLADNPKNLDDLSFPDWDLLDIYSYIKADKGRATWRDEAHQETREISIMTTRGCPFSCTFCAAHTTMGRKMRYRSDDSVIAEMRLLNEKYGINLYIPEDDLFTANRKKVISLLQEINKFGRNIPNFEIQFPNALSVNTLFDDVMDALIEAGMQTTNVAIESGSPYVQRKIIKKNVKLDRAVEVVKYFRDRNVHVRCFFIAGFPEETREMIEETIQYARNLKTDWASFSIAVPLRGSEMYDQFIELGHIKDDISMWSTAIFRERLFDTPEISAEDLKELMYTANLEVNFLNNPNYIDQNWEKSIDLFKSMARDYPFQIFGWYMLMKSYEGAGHAEKAHAAEQKIYDWIEKDERAADIYYKYGHYLDSINYKSATAQALTN